MLMRARNVRGALAISALVGLSTVARSGDGEPERRRTTAPMTSAAAPGDSQGIEAVAIEAAIQRLAVDVKRWGGTVGVAVIDVTTGQAIATLDDHTAFNPASNAKLATAAAAIGLLGPQRRFLTGLYGKITGDSVEELALRGDGDPSLETRDLWAMANDLRAAGIRRVRGISVDQSFFDDRYVPPAFEQQPNEWAPFRAPVAPVSINENTVLFQVRSTKEGKDALVDVDPPGFVDVLGSVLTTKKGDPEKVILGLEAKGARLAAKLGGSLPAGSRLLSVAKRVDDPRLLAGYALRAVLKQIGVDVAGEVRLGGEKQKGLLVAHRSAELGTLVSALGKDSDNFYAEMLFKAIGAEKGRPGSADAASMAVEDYLKEVGAFEAGVVVKNGSGLFDANRTTPWAAARLLRAAYRDPRVGPDFVAQLAIGGIDGTMRSRLRGWAKQRAIRAKTGTLDAVAALSGYILPPPGRSPRAFSILVNGIAGKVSAARGSIDDVVKASAEDLWKDAVVGP
jgi:D-alanyl-D-alanine carboxypeptidase/D-alanyl-D-alanine-endopeptidase (penicillin-binding protein 4)